MNIDFEIPDKKIDTYKNLLLRKDLLIKESEHFWHLYLHKFGTLIEELLNVKIECISLKKKIAYCQARQNRNEIILSSEMEEAIATELADYYDELSEIQNAKNIKGTPIPDYEYLQIKKLYRKIAMMIHPDLHSDLFDKPEIAELWNKARNAYVNNNYEKLKETEFLILQAIKDYSGSVENFEIEDVDKKIEMLREEIEKIVSTVPYQYKFILDNAELVEEEQKELKEETESYQIYIEELKEVFSQFTITEVWN